MTNNCTSRFEDCTNYELSELLRVYTKHLNHYLEAVEKLSYVDEHFGFVNRMASSYSNLVNCITTELGKRF